MAGTVSRREFLRWAGACAAAAARAASLLAGDKPPGKRPNFLFLFTDDQRFSTLGALNNPAVRTPNIDRLTAAGTAFTHTYIQGSTSGAVCICSRAMLLTGRSLFRSPYQPTEELALWPETFRKAGYTTFGSGKWHNGPPAYARCFTRGGKIFFGGMSDHLKVPVCDFDPDGKYPASKRYIGEKFSSELFSDAAIEFLKGCKPGEPFFAYVSYTAPHDPRMAPPDYAALYPPDKIELPPNFLPGHPFDNGELRIRDENLAPFPRTPEVVRQHVAAYYAMITHVDAQIGRVLKALDETGLADNTIVIFSGDNGLAVGQHGLMGKQNLYEHSVRVPLVFRGPGIAAGRKTDALNYLHDLFPTTCELAGLDVPETVESVSLAPLLAGRKPAARESIYAAYKGLQRMVRDERWKLIRYPRADRTQLFDLQSDPWEMKDLSADPQQAARIASLNALLKKWQEKVGDTLDVDRPQPEPRPERRRAQAGGAGSPGAPVKPDAGGAFTLEPRAARTTGRLRYQPDRDNLGGWQDAADIAEWRLEDAPAGAYRVEFTYGSTNPGVAYTIAAGKAALTGKTVHTGGMRNYKAFDAGTIDLPAGPVTLAIRPGPFTGAIMNFRLLKLTPAGK